MKTSPADAAAGAPALLVFVDAAEAIGSWRLVDGDGSAALRGEATDGLPAAARTWLVVPGDEVAIHWIELAGGLAQAQAAAAARLLLADAAAEPLAALHVAVGRPEHGLTPVAIVPHARMAAWLAAAQAAGLDPDAIVPSPMLLASPETGFIRRDLGARADYRGAAAAFTLEPELAAELLGDAPVETIGEAEFEAGLAATLAAPAIDLRQGPFARRRQWRVEGRRLRRIAALVIALAALTLAVQIATILSYTFAADRLRAEADALAAQAPAGAGRPDFGAAAAILFDAVRATPNVELSRIEYGADGRLGASVMMDGPASLAALVERIEAAGLSVAPGETRSAGGRPTTDLTLGPA